MIPDGLGTAIAVVVTIIMAAVFYIGYLVGIN